MVNPAYESKIVQIQLIREDFDPARLQAFVVSRPESYGYWLEVCLMRAIAEDPFPYERRF